MSDEKHNKKVKSKRYPQEVIDAARSLYLRRHTPNEIKDTLGLNNSRIVYYWCEKFCWEDLVQTETVEQSFARRIVLLTEKDNKTDREVVELDKLTKMFNSVKLETAKAAKIQAEAAAIASGNMDVLDAVNSKGGRSSRKKKVVNDISSLDEAKLNEVAEALFYEYQLKWRAAKNDPALRRNRFILKSRQIGATYYMAFEAFEDAVVTGDNQIFLSASRDQAMVFRAYIISFAKHEFDIELKGSNPITLSNGAELRFLSTNSNTAQSYHGHLYIDEVFWIPKFKDLYKVATGMASHKKWRRTYFSTPSALGHQAYPLWSGELYNKNRSEKEQQIFDISHKTLKDGELGPDKIWRNMVTVEDAEAQGCDLFDIDELRMEYSKHDFDNLFMCQFIDDSQSVFSLEELLKCAVDSKDKWKDVDFTEGAGKPYADKPVAIGYDPSRSQGGDFASKAVVTIPIKPNDKWRLLDKQRYKGKNFAWQAARIKEDTVTYNVQHIGVDVSGLGQGVYENVEKFYPMVDAITYTHERKTTLVLKAMDIIGNGLFEFDKDHVDVIQSFLTIKKAATGSGHISYSSNRTAETGHADVAWSIMHAFAQEDLVVSDGDFSISI